MESIAFGDFQFHAMSHRAGALGMDRPLPAVAKVRAAISVRAGRVRADVPDQRHRHVDPSDPEIRQRRVEGISAAENAVGRRRHDVEGHAVHDRARRRLRCRRDRDHGALRGRRVAPLRRQMVLLACRRRCRADAGAAGRRARRHRGPGAVRAAAAAEGRQPQQLPDRAAEGQARHPLDGQRRDPAARARSPIWSATPGWPQADDGAGQPVAAVARRARRGDDAALRQRGAGVRADPLGVRQDHHRLSAAAPPVAEDHGADRTGAVDVPVRGKRAWTAPMPAQRTPKTSCAS